MHAWIQKKIAPSSRRRRRRFSLHNCICAKQSVVEGRLWWGEGAPPLAFGTHRGMGGAKARPPCASGRAPLLAAANTDSYLTLLKQNKKLCTDSAQKKRCF